MGAGVVIRGRTASPYPGTVPWTKGICMFEKLRRNSYERKAMATQMNGKPWPFYAAQFLKHSKNLTNDVLALVENHYPQEVIYTLLWTTFLTSEASCGHRVILNPTRLLAFFSPFSPASLMCPWFSKWLPSIPSLPVCTHHSHIRVEATSPFRAPGLAL